MNAPGTRVDAPGTSQTHPVHLPDGRRIGETHGSVFECERRRSRHLLVSPEPAWCFDCGVLDELERRAVGLLRIFDTEDGRCYETSLTSVRQYGRPISRGCGPQMALPLRWWSVRDLRRGRAA